MPSKSQTPPTQTNEIYELMELHRKLVQMNANDFVQENDAYSLAQPSPFRFVPTVASNGSATLIRGE